MTLQSTLPFFLMSSDDSSYHGSSDEEENNRNAINVNPELVAFADRTIKSHPLKAAFRKVKTRVRGGEEITAFTDEVEDYLQNLFLWPYCFARYQRRFVDCSCLRLHQQGDSYLALAARLGELFFFI